MHYDKRSTISSGITIFDVEPYGSAFQCAPMLGANELLTLLRGRGVRNSDIARVLKLPSSRVSELFNGTRRLQLDEAKKLVESFGVEEPDSVSPLNGPIARLLVIYAIERLGVNLPAEDPQVEELAQDFRVFAQFAASRKVQQSVETFEGFLEGLRHSRSQSGVA